MNPQVEAALISAAVAACGVIVALISARWSVSSKTAELDLKQRELEKVSAKLLAEAEAIRQDLLKEILARRMDAYADLWKVVIGYGRNWFIEGKPADAAWATEFLTVLNACNAQHGVFFSEDVYRPFFEYRERLILIVAKAKEGLAIVPDDIAALTQLSTHGAPGMKSLAGAMKDDLGSYVRVAIQGG